MAVPDPSPTTAPPGDDLVGADQGGPSLGRSVLIGAVIAVGVAATVFFLIAIPFYTLASFEPNGIDRPVVRTGLFRIAMPVAVVVGLVGGATIGCWLHRGGRWSTSDGGDRYVNR